MSPETPDNLSASVRQRLLNLSREKNIPFELIALHYATERFLFRLSKSPYAEQFILKGAMLFTVWADMPKRVTRDLDMLAFGENDSNEIHSIIQSICSKPVPEDGLIFDLGSIRINDIREMDDYEGFRIRLKVLLGQMRIQMQIDLGFGDVVNPEAQMIDYPGLLDFPAARLRAYPPETVVAEKVQAIVHLGMANSRMKDYYDLFVILDRFNFNLQQLAGAITATFQRRKTEIPATIALGLSDEFALDSEKQKQWGQFLKRQQLDAISKDFLFVVHRLREKLMPVFDSMNRSE